MGVKREIVKGLSMPFFPMRPKTGRRILTMDDVRDIITRLKDGWTVQLKLNGDRAEVGTDADGVHIANRHGTWYGLPVLLDSFKSLPVGTLLDGEVYKKKFYPFEVLAFGGESMLRCTPAQREAQAKEVCRGLNIPWMYEVDEGLLSKFTANMPMIEGVVLKMAGSPYIPLSTATRESDSWIKWKFLGA